MERIIEDELNKWFKDGKTALLIYGARQIGKTYSIRDAAKKNNIDLFEINFYDDESSLKALKECHDSTSLLSTLKLISPKRLLEHKTVIFFDEVQLFPELISMIKFLVDEGSFRYVLSGSMLGVEFKNLKSAPVGYLTPMKMYPLNFYEFSIALGVRKETWSYLEECFKSKKPVLEIIHTRMMKLFYLYLVVGGMPAVINAYIKSNNLNDVLLVQKDLIELYKADFSRYEKDDKKLKLQSIYDNIPSQLSKQNLRFTFVYLNNELKFDRYEDSFLWLKDAGVALAIYITNQIKSPLEVSKEKNNFKLFLSDVGLLSSSFPSDTRVKLALGDIENKIDKGGIFENYIAMELTSNYLTPYYYKGKEIGEIDFLVEVDGNIYAIESKSGKDYKKHKSLDKLIEKNFIDVTTLVLSTSNIEKDGEVFYYPIYMSYFIKNRTLANSIVKVDINGL